MAVVDESRSKYRRTGNLFEPDFIPPPRTNKAIQIVAPPVKTSKVIFSLASKSDDSACSYDGSGDSPLRGASLPISPQKTGKPEPENSLSIITPSVSQQAPEERALKQSWSHSYVSYARSQQSDGIHMPQLAPILRPAPESTLDVYANNYIPIWLAAINEAPATPRYCSYLSTIDYAAYVNSFSGYRTLPTLPPIRLPPIQKVPLRINSASEDLPPQHYGEYFSDALQNEVAAEFENLKALSMYNITFEVEDLSRQLYRFTIPGLREHSPRVDLGDVVKIRPLITEPPQLNLVDRQQNLQVTPRFSGLEFYAIVWGISKPKESVVLRLDGFMPNLLRTCNIIFSIQEHRCIPLWRSIDSTTRLLNAIDDFCSPWLSQMLFPDENHAELQSVLARGDFDLKWFDTQMNFEQQKAVDAVVKANYGCVPYLISGPPGTGKTKTIVETALQLLQSETSEPAPHLLLCAPSDPAADTLATRLSAHLGPSSMLRLNGWSRTFAEVPGKLLPYTYAQNNLFSLPDFETIMRYKVVVTTCRDADMLVQARLTNEALIHYAKKSISAVAPKLSESIDPSQLIHWTALLIDEAAQATEPEALIPLSVVDPVSSWPVAAAGFSERSHPVPQLVMAGDEYQLGPRLFLKSASPLSTSLFARLFARPLYSAHPLSRASGSNALRSTMLPMLRPTFTNLIRNYRSHPAILTVPSVLFYADTLIAECTTLSEVVRAWPGWGAAESVFGSGRVALATNEAEDIEALNSRPGTPACWPVLFVNNSSSDALESILSGNGTGAGGLFNAGEAAIALSIVKSLLRISLPKLGVQCGVGNMHSIEYASTQVANRESVQPSEVVVTSPFRAQVNYLRKIFREAGLYDVDIGPLEAFQGLESRIVVLCTTRTRLGSNDQGRDRFVREDQARGLGVIGDHKKFNVAITRAKEGLVVIGNKACLTCTGDEAWMEFLAFCERSVTKTPQQPLFSGNQRPGRLERALRFAEDLEGSRRKAGEGGGDNGDGVGGRLPKGVGYPTCHQSPRNRLQGNMPSLDEQMFREGLEIMDELRDSVDDDMLAGLGDHEGVGSQGEHDDTADSSAKSTRQVPVTDFHPELGRENARSPATAAVNWESVTPQVQTPLKAGGGQSEILIDILDTPCKTERDVRGAAADTLGKETRNTLDTMRFGCFQLPTHISSGECRSGERETLDLLGNGKVEEFDRNPEAEYERADCATQ